MDRPGRSVAVIAHGVAVLLLLGFALQCADSVVRHSATYDEHVYIAAGYSAFRTGEFQVKPDAPPLVPTLAYVGLRGLELLTHPLTFSAERREALRAKWQTGEDYDVADDFFRDKANGIAMLRSARIPIVLLAIVLGVYVYRFGSLLFGPWGGLLALTLFAFDPNMSAHATIVSCDLPLAAFFFGAVYYFWRYVTEPHHATLIPLLIAVALTIAAKFTGVLVVPVLGVLAAALWIRPPAALRGKLGMTRSQYRATLRKKLVAAVGGTAVCTTLLLMALYRDVSGIVRYVEGMRLIYGNVDPHYQYYLMGRFSATAWPSYYLLATALKTPVPTLLLFALALLPWGQPRYEWHKFGVLLVPLALVHLVAAFDRTNFGLRRVLLAFPFIFVLGARLGSLWWSEKRVPSAWRGAAITVVPLTLLWLIARAIWIHPNELSYFNELAGGPRNGFRYLADSNIDWGQDLPALANYLKRQGIEEVVLSYFGRDDPSRYGIRARALRYEEMLEPTRDVYAVSVQLLVYRKLLTAAVGDPRLDWLTRYEPTAMAGYSIYLYDFREPSPTGSRTP